MGFLRKNGILNKVMLWEVAETRPELCTIYEIENKDHRECLLTAPTVVICIDNIISPSDRLRGSSSGTGIW